jgi:NAD(P)-dependent dehydrogenase (short-subunit alcohol dehydrogenase family)
MTTRRDVLRLSSLAAAGALLPACGSLGRRLPKITNMADIPRSDYGFSTTADEVAAAYDLSGMTMLITGANSGLGYESMRTLSLRGATVIGTARTQQKADEAASEVRAEAAELGTAVNIVPLVCELTDMSSVVACSDRVTAMRRPVDVLMLNAGIMALPDLEQIDVNGMLLEKQFVVNHLGHYLLTRRLLPQVLKADAGRIVVVSSSGHRMAPAGGIQFDNLSGEQSYQGFRNYGQSKLANILFSNELSRLYMDDRLTSNAIHPGVVATNLGRYIRGDKAGVTKRPDKPLGKGQKTPEQGAATQVYVAVDRRLTGVTGFYFEDCNPVEPRDSANDPALARELWDVSAQLVAPYL